MSRSGSANMLSGIVLNLLTSWNRPSRRIIPRSTQAATGCRSGRSASVAGRGQDGQSKAEQPDHPASLGDFITASYSDEVFGTHRQKLIRAFGAPSARVGLAAARPIVGRVDFFRRWEEFNSGRRAPRVLG